MDPLCIGIMLTIGFISILAFAHIFYKYYKRDHSIALKSLIIQHIVENIVQKFKRNHQIIVVPEDLKDKFFPNPSTVVHKDYRIKKEINIGKEVDTHSNNNSKVKINLSFKRNHILNSPQTMKNTIFVNKIDACTFEVTTNAPGVR